MKSSVCLVALAVVCCAGVTMAADVSLRVTCVTTEVDPDGTAEFIIEGNVSTGDNQGLALFGVDVTVTGPMAIDHSADITIDASTGGIATYFVTPGGLTNPAPGGFGGTPTGTNDSLMQVGGAQNTINNPGPTPPAPTAWPIATAVAQGSWTTLAEGSISLSGATEGDYTITLSDAFANVLVTLHSTPDYWEVAQGAIVDGGMTCQFTVGIATPPVIDAVAAWADHSGTERPIAMLDLVGIDPSEPRLGGVTKVVVGFEDALDPGTVITGNVSAAGVDNPGPYTPDSVTPSGGDQVVTIVFNTRLPDIDCYTFDLAGMQSADGGDFEFPEDGQFQIIALEGDADRDGTVSTADGSSITGRLGYTVTDALAQYDCDRDNQISTADGSFVTGRLGRTAPACP